MLQYKQRRSVNRRQHQTPPAATNLSKRYRLGELIAVGGMAEIFRGTLIGAEGFERTVAIKRILPWFSQQPQFVAMFVREAHVTARMFHSNIVSVLGFDRDSNGHLFLVLEFVDGVDLDHLIDSGPLPHEVIIFLAIEILRGLGYAHDLQKYNRMLGVATCDLPACDRILGVVHRDVSPNNILLSWYGAVKIADFGLSKPREASAVSASHALRGKVAFMSPEQVRGQRLDGRSDLFSVGVMLWEMLTGERLFWHEDTTAAMYRVLARTIPRPSTIRPIARDLEDVVMRLLERDLAMRYQTADAALGALTECADVPRLGSADLAGLLAERFPKRAPQSARSVIVPGDRAAPGHTKTLTPRLPRRASRGVWAPILPVALAAFVAALLGALVGLEITREGLSGRETLCRPAERPAH